MTYQSNGVLKCARCSYMWVPRRDKDPERCPRCRSVKWNMPHLTVTCKRCNYTWNSHNGTPKRCPQCGSHQWDIPPRINHCLKCGNTWTSRSVSEPRRCPKCSSTEWFLDAPPAERPRRSNEVEEPIRSAVLERYDKGMSNIEIAIECNIPFSVVQSVVNSMKKDVRTRSEIRRFTDRLGTAFRLEVLLVLRVRCLPQIHSLLVVGLCLLAQSIGLLEQLFHLLMGELPAVRELYSLLMIVLRLGPGLAYVAESSPLLHGLSSVVPLVALPAGLVGGDVVIVPPLPHELRLGGELPGLVLELVALLDEYRRLAGVLVPGGLMLQGLLLGLLQEVLHGTVVVVLAGHPCPSREGGTPSCSPCCPRCSRGSS